MPDKLIEDRYLGDGVYASFDGYHVWLDTRAQATVHAVALDPEVLRALDDFRAAVAEAAAQRAAEHPAKGDS